MRMQRKKAGLIAVTLTVFSMLLGSVNCESIGPSNDVTAAVHQQDHGANHEVATIQTSGHCASDQHGTATHCAVHCSHSGAVLAQSAFISPRDSLSHLEVRVLGSLPNRLSSNLRPPISA